MSVQTCLSNMLIYFTGQGFCMRIGHVGVFVCIHLDLTHTFLLDLTCSLVLSCSV